MALPNFTNAQPQDFLQGILDVATGGDKLFDQSVETLDKNQTNRESGGRQFDSNGQTLVGRRSDGSLPKPSERAYGVSQIQVGTARETARIHGIPFDENKLMTDAQYNKRLGDLHMDDLRKKYGGDEVLAQAAYHSGSGNVDRALSQYGRTGFAKGLGPDGRKYVRSAAAEHGLDDGGAGASGFQKGSGKTAEAPPLPAAPAVTQGDKNRAAGGFTGKIINPHDEAVESALGSLFGERGTQITNTRDLLSAAVEEANQIQEQRLESLKEVVAEKREVNGALAEANQRMQERAAIIFGRQQDLLQRRQERRSMNPIARLFKGITDPRYNEVVMREEDLNNREELELLGNQYSTHRQLLGHQLEQLNDSYALDQAVNQQRQADSNEDIRLASQAISFTGLSIGNIQDALSAQEAIFDLRDQGKKRALDKMPESLMLDLAGQAQAAGGTVQVEGMTFTTRELTEGAAQAEQVRLNMHNLRNSTQLGDMQMADTMETKTIQSMSDSQIADAIAADGQFQGTQLNITKLGEEQAKRQAIGTKGSKAAGGDINVDFTIQSMDRLSRNILVENNALKGLFGHVPSDWSDLDAKHGAILQSVADLMKDSRFTPEQKVEALAKMRPQIEAIEVERNKKLKELATSFGGTNRALTLVAENYLTGRPAPPLESAAGIIAMARGGVPAGSDTSPAAKAILGTVNKMVEQADRRAIASGKKTDQQALQRSVLEYIQNQTRTVVMESVLDDLPIIARSIRDPQGKVHPFAQMSQQDWRNVRGAGAARGVEVVGKGLGIGPDQLRALLKDPGTNEKPSELMRAVRSHKPELAKITIGEISQQLATAQMNATVMILDQQFGTDKFRPSTALANLLANPEVQRRAQGAAFGGNGFVDFTFRSATGGQGQVTLNAYRDKIIRGQQADSTQRLKDVANPAMEASTNPRQRVSLVLNQIDGVNREQRSQFGSYLLSRMGNMEAARMAGGDLWGKRIIPNMGYWAKMDEIVATPIEGNPAMESIRKKVAGKWGIASENISRAFEE